VDVDDDDDDDDGPQRTRTRPRPRLVVYTYHCSLPSPRTTILWCTIALATLMKVMLIPSYRSTDFDVHRNWMALTYYLPLKEWYFDDQDGTTVHTLDYPPLFAYFERLLGNIYNMLSQYHPYFDDDRCLERLPDHDNDVSVSCVVFQRCTVMFLGDVVYLAGAHVFSQAMVGSGSLSTLSKSKRKRNSSDSNSYVVLMMLLILNSGLLLLDHVHFQYNGMMLGLLLASLGMMTRGAAAADTAGSTSEKRKVMMLAGAVCYALLLGFKHIYLTLAPLYFIYLLTHCCCAREYVPAAMEGKASKSNTRRMTALCSCPLSLLSLFVKRLLVLGTMTLVVLVAPYVPFLMQQQDNNNHSPLEQLQQIAHRLFPFGRGLVHSYWAGNLWAIGLSLGKASKLLIPLTLREMVAPLMEHTYNMIIPTSIVSSIAISTPAVCAMLTLMTMTPALVQSWRWRWCPQPQLWSLSNNDNDNQAVSRTKDNGVRYPSSSSSLFFVQAVVSLRL
jgi:alpha-1,3-glucosyltransferase